MLKKFLVTGLLKLNFLKNMLEKNSGMVALVRHGESLGNLENRFTGWLDVDITKKGWLESYQTGIKMKKLNYKFNLCYTSKLKRSIKTAEAILCAMDLNNIKIKKEEDLNERNYGKLLGMNKIEAYLKYGKEKVNDWLNNYEKRPPILEKNDARFKIIKIKNKKYTLNESLDDILKRVLKFWKKKIITNIKKNILIISHSNILKILINYISKEKKNKILKNSQAIIYELKNKKLYKI